MDKILRLKWVFGLKISRLSAWWGVIQEEEVQMSAKNWWHMLKEAFQILKTGGIRGKDYLRRLKTCSKCPIKEPGAWRCRPYTGSELGCGCFIPYTARSESSCWGYEHTDGELGWD